MRIIGWISDVCSSVLPRRRGPGALGERDQTREEHIIDLPVGADRLAPQLRLKSRDAMPRLQDRLVLDRLPLGKNVADRRGVGGQVFGHEAIDLLRIDAARKSAERRVGKECGMSCRSQWST